jgi:hypothetical protein
MKYQPGPGERICSGRGGDGILQGEVDANAAGRRQTTAKEKQHQEGVGKILQSLKPVS